jgi:large subunit ribosomal protein L18
MKDRREIQRVYRHRRIRKKIVGTSERPRVCLHRSSRNIAAQVIDDADGKVIFGMSTLAKDLRKKIKNGGNLQAAEVLGEAFAKEAQKKGIKQVRFDRGGYLYHGRIKAFAEAARKGGLEF